VRHGVRTLTGNPDTITRQISDASDITDRLKLVLFSRVAAAAAVVEVISRPKSTQLITPRQHITNTITTTITTSPTPPPPPLLSPPPLTTTITNHHHK
jgi:hypothetical protein